MAVSTKTPNISMLTDLLSLPFKPKTQKFLSVSPTPQILQLSLNKPSATLNSSPITNTTNPNPQISLLCSQGKLQEALQILVSSSKQESLFPIDEESYISLLRLCESKRANMEGARVYAHICSSTPLMHFSIRLGNALLSMFVRFGNLLDAWVVFGKMAERDVFSWNVMVGGYAKAGFLDEALNLYHQMLWVGIRPDLYTFPCILRTCAGMSDLDRGREIHVHVIRFGYESEIDAANALITMYSKCGDVFSGRKLFDAMPSRDRISWNAMISGHFENGECLDGLHLFVRMLVLSIEPDLMTLTSVISGCELLDNARLGREIHGYAIKTEFDDDVSVCNALIQMYASLQKLEAAEMVFIRMGYKDVVSWTAMISGYDKNELPTEAVNTYEQMKLEGVMPDELTIATVLSACSSLKLLDMGVELHELANREGLISYTIVGNMLTDLYSKSGCVDKALDVFKRISEKNVISWTSMILGLRINNKSFEALNFFRKMQFDVQPSSVTLIAALAACASIGALMCGKEIHAHVLRSGLAFEGFIPNALLDMYAKCGRMVHAHTQFSMHESKDLASWNIMLTGCAKGGHGALAIGFFHRMIQVGFCPDEITFVALLCACSRSGMVTEGLEYFNSMSQHYSVIPNLKHYTCMVDLLGRAGQVEEAHEFIEKMPIVPDAGVWGALLNACRIHRRVDLGELAARFIFESDMESVGYYVLLCNLYADAGRWDAVAKVRRLMRERGLSVDPGCSWVEAKGTVHAFLSGDESHPQIKEIYAVLNGLYERIKEAGFDMSENCSVDEIAVSKEEIFCGHSERLAVAFGLINTIPGMPIWVTKNLYMCSSCHDTIKFMSKVVRREITVRDTEQFHHFKDGSCSCGDEGYWGQRNK